MNFNAIKKYPHYGAYQRILKIKEEQCKYGYSLECLPKTYDNYLNKINGLLCCCDASANCCYNGAIAGSLALNATMKTVNMLPDIGYNSSHGSLVDRFTSEGYEVLSFTYTAASQYQITLRSPPLDLSGCCQTDISGVSSGVMFNNIVMSKGKNRIELELRNSNTWVTINPTDTRITWEEKNVSVTRSHLTAGKWCFKMYL